MTPKTRGKRKDYKVVMAFFLIGIFATFVGIYGGMWPPWLIGLCLLGALFMWVLTYNKKAADKTIEELSDAYGDKIRGWDDDKGSGPQPPAPPASPVAP